MAFCEQCGNKINDTAKFCDKCGTPVASGQTEAQAEIPQASVSTACAQCGAPLEEGEMFCANCGAKVGAVPQSPQAIERQIDEIDQSVKYRNLFEAYAQGILPFYNGYIVSSFFSENSVYSIYEIVSYVNTKEIFPSDTGLQFIASGKKLYILVEHDTYKKKFIEPVSRAQGENIPKRFAELDIIIAKNQTKIMIAKGPDEITGSFTILKPVSLNFAVVFCQQTDVIKTIAAFFEDSLNKQRKVPQSDAKKAAQLIASIVEKSMRLTNGV